MKFFYDIRGEAVAYLHKDKTSIFMLNGKPVAWLSEDCIYSIHGKYLGWFENGWIYDTRGRCALFTPKAKGGPPIPAIKPNPAPGERGLMPIRVQATMQPVRKPKSPTWSDFSGPEFFLGLIGIN